MDQKRTGGGESHIGTGEVGRQSGGQESSSGNILVGCTREHSTNTVPVNRLNEGEVAVESGQVEECQPLQGKGKDE